MKDFIRSNRKIQNVVAKLTKSNYRLFFKIPKACILANVKRLCENDMNMSVYGFTQTHLRHKDHWVNVEMPIPFEFFMKQL